jgi:hypothetical protein
MRNGSLIAALVVAFGLSGPALAQDAESAAERPERGDRVLLKEGKLFFSFLTLNLGPINLHLIFK